LGTGVALERRDISSTSGVRHRTLADHSLQLTPS
jgi:hypothetical protein